jgi:DNA-binding response OmpR family regulator
MRILLAEDDKNLGEALKAGLAHDGFQVDWVRDGQAAIYESKSTQYAALVLDIGLPLKTGFEVLQELRSQGIKTPILVLTAQDGVESITQGLDLGGDDYVIKPVALQVLVAKLRALIRRSEGLIHNQLTAGELSLNPATYEVFLSGQLISVSKKEFALLHVLMTSANRVMTKSQLEQQLYSWGHEVESNAIEVHIHNIRKKIGNGYIHTIRGIGYQFKANT